MLENKKIVIVGGGTAGWMAASHFAKAWCNKGISIEVIDSSEIGIIGVGEGSTPSMCEFLKRLDVKDSDWMPQCNATYKAGIRFVDWTNKPEYKSYFHPFFSHFDQQHESQFFQLTQLRRQGLDHSSHPDPFFLNTYLTNSNLSPAQNSSEFGTLYSYHFDSSLLGEVLKKIALGYGVTHRDIKITSVNLNETGDISNLELEDGDRIHADFFVDCSGFRSLLMGQALGVPFEPFSDCLLNDRAIALPTPLDNNALPQTISTAMPHGWRWQIPLTSRYGNGYVYSSAHTSDDEAETALRQSLGLSENEGTARKISMRVGKLKSPWFRNCIAVGLAQGFIEPLEATALHFIGKSIIDFVDAFGNGGFSNAWQEAYNDRVNRDYAYIKDYILLHYRTNTRTDTDYWHDARNSGKNSDLLNSIFDTWFQGGDLNSVILSLGAQNHFSSASWHCLLAGMGVFPPTNQNLNSYNENVKKTISSIRQNITNETKHFAPALIK